MKVYCINLDRRPDRLEHMTGVLADHRITFERVVAVDGRDPSVAAAACQPGLYGHRLSAGAYGCFQSHREVWRRLLASGERHAMVLEDDLVIAEGLRLCLGDTWVPSDADLVKLEANDHRVRLDRGRGLAVGGRRLHRLRSRHAGTGAYVISARTAQHLLAATEVITDPIDEALFNEDSALFDTLTIYQMVPAPVIQGRRDETVAAATAAGGTAVGGWQTSSIDVLPDPGPKRRKGLVARVQQRLSGEIRAVKGGMRYVLVSFG